MEELREAALAYYNNGSPELQKLALDFFNSLDLNRDGQVGLNEFVHFLRQSGCHWIPSNFFDELDHNHDGKLDFSEVLTLYYIVKTRRVWCSECNVLLKGLHFTCVTCFDNPYYDNTYDLCASCYRQQRFSHHHNYFLDNYMLLRCKKGNDATYVNQVLAPPTIIYNEVPPRNDWLMAFHALEAAVAVGNLVGCNIM